MTCRWPLTRRSLKSTNNAGDRLHRCQLRRRPRVQPDLGLIDPIRCRGQALSCWNPFSRLTHMSNSSSPKGRPMAVVSACRDAMPPPSMSATATNPVVEHQNIRCLIGASTFQILWYLFLHPLVLELPRCFQLLTFPQNSY